MQQNINLFSQLPTVKHSRFSYQSSWMLYVIFLGILSVNYFNELRITHNLTNQMQVLQVESDALTAKLAVLESLYPELDVNALQLSVQNLFKETDLQQTIIDVLSVNHRFSSYLEEIALAYVPGVWLTSFNFKVLNEEIIFKGSALQPLLVQHFLEQLLKQPHFQHLHFEIISLTQVFNGNNSLINFTISNRAHE